MRPCSALPLIAAALATLATLTATAAGAEPAPRDVVIEPSPERDGAIAAGRDTVTRAQGLAREQRYARAVELLERVATEWPAAVHDCNLSLAYLRAGQLTRAHLWWDVSALRGGDRPDWCTGTLTTQLNDALRAAGYVPVSLHVNPAYAVIQIGDVRLRSIPVVWLAPGTSAVVATADGHVSQQLELAVTAPRTKATLTLASIDAGEPAAIGDTPATAQLGAEPIPEDARRDLDGDTAPLPPPRHATRWPAWVALGAGGAALAFGAGFHAAAISARDEANQLPVDAPEFADALDRFEGRRSLALGGYAVGAIAVGVGAWWWFTHPPGEVTPRLSAQASRDGATVTLGGRW